MTAVCAAFNIVAQHSINILLLIAVIAPISARSDAEMTSPTSSFSSRKSTGEVPGSDDPHRTPCEAGYPCSTDQWCSPSKKICRPCSDLENWCNDTATIHTNYAACEEYCYRYEAAKTAACRAELTEAEQNIRNMSRKLQNIEDDLKLQSEEIVKYQSELQMTKDHLKRSIERRKDMEEEINGLVPGVAISVLIAVGFAALTAYLFNKNKHLKRALDDAATVGNGDNQPLVAGVSTDSSGTEGSLQSKSPIPADRVKCDFKTEEDKYCLPGGGGRADVQC